MVLVALVIAISAKHFNSLVAGLFIGSINTTRLVTLYACKPVGACRIFTQRTQCPSCTMGMNTKSHLGTCPRMLLALLVCLYSWTQSGSTIQYWSDMCLWLGVFHPHMEDIHGPCRCHLSVGAHWLQFTFPDVNGQIQPSTKKLEFVLHHNITTWEYLRMWIVRTLNQNVRLEYLVNVFPFCWPLAAKYVMRKGRAGFQIYNNIISYRNGRIRNRYADPDPDRFVADCRLDTIL